MQRRRNQQRNQQERRGWACDIKKTTKEKVLREISLAHRIFVSFVFFVVKKWAVMMLFDADFDAYFVRKNDK